MNVKDVTNTLKLGKNAIKSGYKKNEPFWLAVGSAAGVIIVALVSAKEGPKVKDGVSKGIKSFKEAETTEEKVAVVLDTAKEVAGPVVKITAAIGTEELLIKKSYDVSNKRLMAALGLAVSSQMELKDFKEMTREVVGKKKVQTIEESRAAKKFSEMPDDPSMFDDNDENNPDIFECSQSGIKFRGNYFDVQKGINATFIRLKAGGEPIVWSQLFSDINDYKSGEPIKHRGITDNWIFDPIDVTHTDDIQDFVKLIYAGPHKYEIVYDVELHPNPDTFGKAMEKEDLARFYAQVGDHSGKAWY